MKLHLCCGDVYLQGYVNIDSRGIYSTSDTKRTNIHNYYTRELTMTGNQGTVYVDVKCDITKGLIYKDNSIDEVLMICGIEHFTKEQGLKIFKEVYRVLKDGGKFIFDFPDLVLTILSTEPEDAMRLIYGSCKDVESAHKYGYTINSIKDILKYFRTVKEEIVVKHPYPMIGIVATK